MPEIRYPDELPVSQRRQDIAAAIRDHQVVVIAGETGSGKTTQIPKICLELGRGVQGLIGLGHVGTSLGIATTELPARRPCWRHARASGRV